MIKILLFAGLAEQAGTQMIEYNKNRATTDEIKDLLKEQYGLQSIDTAMVAINEIYAKENTPLISGDTIALIPPVSGG
ncbi:molybdopterin converting factor subunit 1 [Bacillus atrophaeus]|nr:molybdopterin converting factor subunit 1 [Bacillus atrophaeus]